MILFIDTEATGLIQDNMPMEDERQPRLVSVAAILTNDHDVRRPIRTLNATVKPQGFTIPEGGIHGITHDYAAAFGDPLPDVLDTILRMAEATTTDPITSRMVGYNIAYDTFVLSREMHFVHPPAVAQFAALRPFCLMRALAHIWRQRWISLDAAYTKLFPGKVARPEGKHNAMLDCLAAVDIFEEGRSRGWWR